MPRSTILHYTDSVCANVCQMSSVTEDLLQSKAEFLPAKESLELNVILKYGSPISFFLLKHDVVSCFLLSNTKSTWQHACAQV